MKKVDKINMALDLANKGLTENEICEKLNINIRTMRRYKQENEQLRTILSESNKLVNKAIKELGRLATGYVKDVEEYHKIKVEEITPEGKVIKKEELVKVNKKVRVAGDVQAIKYLLNNRDMERWRDNPQKVLIDKENIELKRKEVQSKIIDV